MTTAEKTFRDGFAPCLPTAGLRALLAALEADDPRLTQGSTTTPPPLMCVQDWPVEGADAVAFVGVSVLGGFCPPDDRQDPIAVLRHARVGDVEEFFARACFDADNRLGDPAACRFFLNWFDDTPRDVMRHHLAEWIHAVLTERGDTEPDSVIGPKPVTAVALDQRPDRPRSF